MKFTFKNLQNIMKYNLILPILYECRLGSFLFLLRITSPFQTRPVHSISVDLFASLTENSRMHLAIKCCSCSRGVNFWEYYSNYGKNIFKASLLAAIFLCWADPAVPAMFWKLDEANFLATKGNQLYRCSRHCCFSCV